MKNQLTPLFPYFFPRISLSIEKGTNTMRLLRMAAEIKDELMRLVEECSSCQIAVAWASSGFDAFDLLLQQKDKIARMVVGIHFYQTHPGFIEAFLKHPNVRFVMFTDGVFHPKVYFFEKPSGGWECLIGSPNFTKAGFGVNDEMAVLVTDEDNGAQEFFSRVKESINDYWQRATMLSRDDLTTYERVRKKKYRFLKRLRRKGNALDKERRVITTEKKAIVDRFAEPIMNVLARYGPMDKGQINRKIQEDYPQLCTDRDIDRPYSVWKHDIANCLETLQNKGLVVLNPKPGWIRKGIYSLVDVSSSARRGSGFVVIEEAEVHRAK